jgi:hypothetical protein
LSIGVKSSIGFTFLVSAVNVFDVINADKQACDNAQELLGHHPGGVFEVADEPSVVFKGGEFS